MAQPSGNQKLQIVAHVTESTVTFTLSGRLAPKYEGSLFVEVTCYYHDAEGREWLGPAGRPTQNTDGSFGPVTLFGERASALLYSTLSPYQPLALLDDFWVA